MSTIQTEAELLASANELGADIVKAVLPLMLSIPEESRMVYCGFVLSPIVAAMVEAIGVEAAQVNLRAMCVGITPPQPEGRMH
jgi:hypothetical protein